MDIKDAGNTAGEPKPSKEQILKVTINNINIVGKILVEEGKIIEEFLKGKQIIGQENQESFKRNLENVAVALGVSAKYFESKIQGLENELKNLTDKQS